MNSLEEQLSHCVWMELNKMDHSKLGLYSLPSCKQWRIIPQFYGTSHGWVTSWMVSTGSLQCASIWVGGEELYTHVSTPRVGPRGPSPEGVASIYNVYQYTLSRAGTFTVIHPDELSITDKTQPVFNSFHPPGRGHPRLAVAPLSHRGGE